MNIFDKIIGYSSIKEELIQISDILKNNEAYEKLGVYVPRGLILYGNPGVGKSLMASTIIESSGRKTFTCRKDQPNGEFVKDIKATFDKAAQNAPSIVYLDDMDKFANGDENHTDAEEYVTVQSCVDEVKEKEVFVLATVNNINSLPRSLCRPGRFDRIIKVDNPRGDDAVNIISHYLQGKKFIDGIDSKNIAKIMDGSSCAELETVINEAGLYAGYKRAEYITMDNFMKACLKTVFRVPSVVDQNENCDLVSLDTNSAMVQVMYHEAGHAVISEILSPESVTLISIYNMHERPRGFTSIYNDRSKSQFFRMESSIMVALGGKAALEHKFGFSDMGCIKDIDHAFDLAYDMVAGNCIYGFNLHRSVTQDSQTLLSAQEQATACVVERYYNKAKKILLLNHDFLERIVEALMKKSLLSIAEITQIKNQCKIEPVNI